MLIDMIDDDDLADSMDDEDTSKKHKRTPKTSSAE